MNAYIEPIRFAFLIFPLIAFLMTLPYIFHQYHKYGSILFFRVSIVYSFALYLTCIYFLVILPLPSMEQVSQLTTDWVQITPFAFIRDFLLESSFIWNEPSTYIEVIKEPYFYQVFYNILLTVPFGIYLRYYFRCSFKKTCLLTFLLTLFFEGTQLSGLYGIYPRPYRLFDIDDLFLNTIGGIIGYAITPLFSKWLPKRKTLEQLSYRKGQKISIIRRGMAVWIDLFLVSLMTMIFSMVGIHSFLIQYVCAITLIFMVIPTIKGGVTFGKKWMNIKIVTLENEQPKWYQYVIRYGILYLFLFLAPYYFSIHISILYLFKNNAFISLLIIVLLLLTYVVMFFHGLISLFRKRLFWYETLSRTKLQSTIVQEEIVC